MLARIHSVTYAYHSTTQYILTYAMAVRAGFGIEGETRDALTGRLEVIVRALDSTLIVPLFVPELPPFPAPLQQTLNKLTPL